MVQILHDRSLSHLELSPSQKQVLQKLRSLLPPRHQEPETQLPYLYKIPRSGCKDLMSKMVFLQLQDLPVMHYECPVSFARFQAPLVELHDTHIGVYPVTLYRLHKMGIL